jgi:hypothetical protein
MPDTKTDPLVEIDHPEIKMEQKEDFRALKKLVLKMYEYCGNLIDNGAQRSSRIEQARQHFYESYHGCTKMIDRPDRFDEDERMEVYAQFMRGMWVLLANREQHAVDSPADWSLIWELEETCSQIYSKWTRRHKV